MQSEKENAPATAGKERSPLRSIQDSVFRNLFSRPEYLLQLYRVLHPEDTAAVESDLGNITIQNVLVGSLYNDLGFTVRDKMLILVEAQSTWTVNIVWRLLLYQAETLNRYFQTTRQNTYAERKLQVPAPEFYVLYTGERQAHPRWISLADEFLNGDTSRLELRAEVLYGDGDGDILNQYVAFTKVYREQVSIHGRTELAIRETIRICTDRNILAEYLKAHEQEVRSSMLTLFDQEYLTKLYGEEQRQEGREEGREEGLMEGREEGQLIMLYKLVKGGVLPLSDAAANANQSTEYFQANMEQYFASAG